MTHAERLLERLDAIGRALSRAGGALALLGLGSAGSETERLDEYSDLDFFVIVERGYKQAFIDDLGWLSAPCPLAFGFRNTPDGFKALYEDGIYCEFAVFEAAEMPGVTFAAGRVVWSAPGFDASICTPRPAALALPAHSRDWIIGEAVTCLYVGLGRFRRGEKLSAQRFIQHYAVDRILELAPWLEAERPAFADAFSGERRFEARFPGIAARLPDFVQGYERSPESALAILAFLEERAGVHPAMKRAILALAAR